MDCVKHFDVYHLNELIQVCSGVTNWRPLFILGVESLFTFLFILVLIIVFVRHV